MTDHLDATPLYSPLHRTRRRRRRQRMAWAALLALLLLGVLVAGCDPARVVEEVGGRVACSDALDTVVMRQYARNGRYRSFWLEGCPRSDAVRQALNDADAWAMTLPDFCERASHRNWIAYHRRQLETWDVPNCTERRAVADYERTHTVSRMPTPLR